MKHIQKNNVILKNTQRSNDINDARESLIIFNTNYLKVCRMTTIIKFLNSDHYIYRPWYLILFHSVWWWLWNKVEILQFRYNVVLFWLIFSVFRMTSFFRICFILYLRDCTDTSVCYVDHLLLWTNRLSTFSCYKNYKGVLR